MTSSFLEREDCMAQYYLIEPLGFSIFRQRTFHGSALLVKIFQGLILSYIGLRTYKCSWVKRTYLSHWILVSYGWIRILSFHFSDVLSDRDGTDLPVTIWSEIRTGTGSISDLRNAKNVNIRTSITWSDYFSRKNQLTLTFPERYSKLRILLICYEIRRVREFTQVELLWEDYTSPTWPLHDML